MISLRFFSTLLALPLVLAACGEPPVEAGRDRSGAVLVVAEAIQFRPMTDTIETLGTAGANESIEIRPRIASLIERIAFEEGQLVRSGDLLVELENSEIVAGLRVAEAALSESRSLYERSKSLASTQAISAANLETLHAQVLVDEAQVQAARARLDNTVIRAPFSGRIGLRRVSPGSFVSNTTVITTLDDVSQIKLDFAVPEAFLTAIREGMSIAAVSLVYPDRIFSGTIASIDTRLDPVTRAVQVRAIIPNEDDALKPGMFMSVGLQRDRGDVLAAPEQSIVPEGSQQFVFVVSDGIARKRAVQLGRRIPGFVAVDDGLVAGEIVVVEGTRKFVMVRQFVFPTLASAENNSYQD